MGELHDDDVIRGIYESISYEDFYYHITANTTVKRDKSSLTFTELVEGVLTIYAGTETLKNLKARYDQSRPKKCQSFGPKKGFTRANSFGVRAYDPAEKKDNFKPARIMVEGNALWLRIDHEPSPHCVSRYVTPTVTPGKTYKYDLDDAWVSRDSIPNEICALLSWGGSRKYGGYLKGSCTEYVSVFLEKLPLELELAIVAVSKVYNRAEKTNAVRRAKKKTRHGKQRNDF